jgi:hypothetical protein
MPDRVEGAELHEGERVADTDLQEGTALGCGRRISI